MTIDFTHFVDLASERIGGKALFANDDFFAPKENLLKQEDAVFVTDRYTDRGKWMDGWETRRRRTSGHDFCVIELGCAGRIRGVDVDTTHFLGNHPPFASLDASLGEKETWVEVLSKSPLAPGSHNLFSIQSEKRWTHVRLNIFPDGGVARLRVYGDVIPDWNTLKNEKLIDLASVKNGGVTLCCNDMFFGPKDNLIMPGRALNMKDGWETKRKRESGHDWVIVKLGHSGILKKIEVDTNHFKGNYPDQCSLEGCLSEALSQNESWIEILPRTKLQPHTQHFFEKEMMSSGPFNHVRLNIYPDGGISRLRIFGQMV